MKKIVFLLVVFSGLIFMSCNDDKDTVGPSIDVSNPKENVVFKAGDIVPLDVTLKDESSIGYFEYEFFSYDNDLYSHKEKKEIDYVLNELSFKSSFMIPKMIKEEIPFPAGDYVIKFVTVDIYGNTTVYIRNVKVQSGE